MLDKLEEGHEVIVLVDSIDMFNFIAAIICGFALHTPIIEEAVVKFRHCSRQKFIEVSIDKFLSGISHQIVEMLAGFSNNEFIVLYAGVQTAAIGLKEDLSVAHLI